MLVGGFHGLVDISVVGWQGVMEHRFSYMGMSEESGALAGCLHGPR